MGSSAFVVGQLWRRLHKEIHELFRDAYGQSDVPMVAVYLLRQIDERPGVTISELGRRTGTAKSHVSNVIEQLVEQGYVEKRSDREDQRLQRLYVTPTARQALDAAETRAGAAWDNVIGRMSPTEWDELMRLLKVLLQALREQNAERRAASVGGRKGSSHGA